MWKIKTPLPQPLTWVINGSIVATDILIQSRTSLFIITLFALLLLTNAQGAEYLIVLAERVDYIRTTGGASRGAYIPTVFAFWIFTLSLFVYTFLHLIAFARIRYQSLLSRRREFLVIPAATVAIAPTLFMQYSVGPHAVDLIRRRGGADHMADNLTSVITINFWAITMMLVGVGLVVAYVRFRNLKTHRYITQLYSNAEISLQVLCYVILPIFVVPLWLIDVLFSPLPVFMQRGAFHIVIVSLTTMLILISNVHVHFGRRGLPVTMLFLVAFGFANIFHLNLPPASITLQPDQTFAAFRDAGRERTAVHVEKYIANRNALRDARIQAWIDQRVQEHRSHALGRRLPLYIVAAQGGGSYAAYHTAKVLARAAQYDPLFAKRLFAISATSGGSVGAAIYASFATDNGTHDLCDGAGAAYWARTEAAIDTMFRADLISPILAHFFRVDFLREFGVVSAWEFMSGQALAARDVALISALRSVHAEANSSQVRLGDSTLGESAISGHGPALFFNITSASGNRVYTSPWSAEPIRPWSQYSGASLERQWFQTRTQDRFKVLEAAIFSARFPLVTPAGHIKAGRTSYRFLDGGYSDNSGILTAEEIKVVLRQVITDTQPKDIRDQIDIVLLVTTVEDAGEKGPVSDRPWFNEWLSPLLLPVGMITARGQEVVSDAGPRNERPPHEQFVSLPIRAPIKTLPLAWSISAQTRRLVATSVDFTLPLPPKPSATAEGQERNGARQLSQMLTPCP